MPSADRTAVLNTYGYTFDGIGNRTDRNYAANSANQYKKNPDAANADIDYDLRGNMTTDGVFDFTWNSANQLTSATPKAVVTLEQETTAHEQGNDLPASRKVEFGYDDAGRRIWKKSYVYSSAASAWLARETRKFVYDGNNLVAEFVVDPNGMDRLSRAYAWGKGIAGSVGGLLSITTFADDGATPTATYIPLYDDRGNVVGLANASDGKLVAVYQYDPFGKLIGEAGDKAVLDANPFGFNTMYTDRETGLVWFQPGGYYSPALQRRLSREPAGEGESANLYVMFHNDPINRVDPDGFDDHTLVDVDPEAWKQLQSNLGAMERYSARPGTRVRAGRNWRYDDAAEIFPALAVGLDLNEFRREKRWFAARPQDNPFFARNVMEAVENGTMSISELAFVFEDARRRGVDPAEDNGIYATRFHFEPDRGPDEVAYAMANMVANEITFGLADRLGLAPRHDVPKDLRKLEGSAKVLALVGGIALGEAIPMVFVKEASVARGFPVEALTIEGRSAVSTLSGAPKFGAKPNFFNPTGCVTNCTKVAVSTEQALRGTFIPAAVGERAILFREVQSAFGGAEALGASHSAFELENALNFSLANHGESVLISASTGKLEVLGHSFNAVNVRGTVHIIDNQIGVQFPLTDLNSFFKYTKGYTKFDLIRPLVEGAK